jgi:plastocyanin
MNLRALPLLAVVPFIGIAVAVIPTLAAGDAPPATASFTAVDFAWQATDGAANAATIAQDGTVTFGYPNGSSTHNVDFGTGAQPTSCTQSAGADSGAVPPLPAQPTSPGWSGTCTFDTPGTYTFHCDLHPSMTATITVLAPGATSPTSSTTTGATTTTMTTTTSATTTTTTTGTPSPPTVPTADRSPLAGSAARAIVIAHRQRGRVVRGSLKVAAAGVHGTATIEVLATPSQLRPSTAAGRRARRPVSVGNLSARLTRSGPRAFAVALNRAARSALARGRVLSLTVVVTVRSPQGVTASARRGVLLRRDGG